MGFETLPLAAGCWGLACEASLSLSSFVVVAGAFLACALSLRRRLLVLCGRRAELLPTCGPQATAVHRVPVVVWVGTAACHRPALGRGRRRAA